VIDCLSSPFVSSSVSATGALQVPASPTFGPWGDFDTRIALWFRFWTPRKLSEIAYGSPFGENETHGSEARRYPPPAQALNPGRTTRLQVLRCRG
jgi:hypothetical protein